MLNVIFAPHPDDEVIGCFDIIRQPVPMVIVYPIGTDMARLQEGHHLCSVRARCEIRVGVMDFLQKMPSFDEAILHFPHPVTEVHPLHRRIGAEGERVLRGGAQVVFYTTLMNVPWIYEVDRPEGKRDLLNQFFPGQRTLWEMDHKFWLFEGHTSWNINGRI